MVAYLRLALDEGDAQLIAGAVGDLARQLGMSAIAQKTGLSRENLYRALSYEGSPKFETVVKVMAALGLKLTVVPAS